ncbi:MAG: hypothetical protein ACFBSE_11675 [Prochloraceae cyanobacterium]
MNNKFASLVKEIKDTLELSQVELGKIFGVSQPAIGAWLRGEVSPAKVSTSALIKIADLKKWSIQSLFDYLDIIPEELSESSPAEKFKDLLEGMLVGKKQKTLSKELKVSEQALSNWLKGIDPTGLSPIELAKIAKAKKWTLDELFINLGIKKEIVSEKDVSEDLDPDLIISQIEKLSLSQQLKVASKVYSLVEKIHLKTAEKLNQTLLFSSTPIEKTVLIIDEKRENINHFAENFEEIIQIEPKHIFLANNYRQIKKNLVEHKIDFLVLIIRSNQTKDLGMKILREILDDKYDNQVIVISSYSFKEGEIVFYQKKSPKIFDFQLMPVNYFKIREKMLKLG